MSEEKIEEKIKQPWSFELFLRKLFKGIIDPIAGFFLKIGLKPNAITILGLLLSTLSAYFLAIGKIPLAGLILLVGGPLDVIDGSMARKLGEPTKFGAFFDSVIDRYAELIVFAGLMIYYIQKANQLAMILVFISAAGSVLVSYVKARAEALGFTAKVGILTRVERLIVLIFCFIINVPMVALWIVAILANVTAIQRMLFVHKQALLLKD